MEDKYNVIFNDFYYGKMSETEITEFKKRLKEDTALSKAFRKFQLNLKLGVFNDSRKIVEDVQAKLEAEGFFEREKEEKQQPKTSPILEEKKGKIIPLYSRLAIAASVIGLLIIGYLFFQKPSFNSIEITQYEKTWDATKDKTNSEIVESFPEGMVEDNSPDEMLQTATIYNINDKDSLAIEVMNDFFALPEDKLIKIDTAYYIYGDSYRSMSAKEKRDELKKREYLKYAKENFLLISDDSKLFNSKYTSLFFVYYGLDELSKAATSIKNVAESSDTTFRFEAKNILEKLNK